MRLLLLLVVCFVPSVFPQKIDPEGKAIIYVYSNAFNTTLGRVRKPVYMDDREIADIRPERYFVAVVEPGKRAFHLRNKKFGGVVLDVKAGQSYYLRINWKSGFTVSLAGIESVPAENGEFDINQLKPVDKGNIKDTSIVTLSL